MTWFEEIAEHSESPEFQTAEIDIFYVSEKGKYDVDTDTYAPDVIETPYSGRARIIPVRWGVNNQNVQQANPTNLKAYRFQIPTDGAPAVIRKGWKVRVKSTPRLPTLVNKVVTVTDDGQGASAASRTFECSVDMDSTWG